jgi:PAS domain S-box-containing protein
MLEDDIQYEHKDGVEGQILRQRLRGKLLDALGIAIVATDRAGKIIYWNTAAQDLFGWGGEILGRNFLKITRGRLLSENILEAGAVSKRIIEHRDQLGLPVLMVESDVVDEKGQLIGYVSAFTNAREPGSVDSLFSIEERARLIQLPNLGEGLKPLSGITLTLCSACSKSKDEEGQWLDLEEYLKNNLDADLSHSLCSTCAKQMYPELFKPEDE